MTEPWQCPACSVWLAPSVSQHRCDGGQGSAGATVTPIVPTGGGGGTATVTYPVIAGTGQTITAFWANAPGVTAGQVERWKAAARSQAALAILDEMLERAAG